MRKDINIELVRDERNAITAFNVYYSSGNPEMTRRWTRELPIYLSTRI